MKTDDFTAPATEAFFALQRVALLGAETLSTLNVEAIRALSQQAAAAQDLPPSAAALPWLAAQATELPQRMQASLTLSRRAYAICATTTADWLGVCAASSEQLTNQSLDAVAKLTNMLPPDKMSAAVDPAQLRRTLVSAHEAYRTMLGAFREAADTLAQTASPVEPAPRRKRGRA